jgi:hypothetical protein
MPFGCFPTPRRKWIVDSVEHKIATRPNAFLHLLTAGIEDSFANLVAVETSLSIASNDEESPKIHD